MSQDDPFGAPPNGGIRRPTPGRQPADGPFSGDTIIRPKRNADPLSGDDKTIVRPRPRRPPVPGPTSQPPPREPAAEPPLRYPGPADRWPSPPPPRAGSASMPAAALDESPYVRAARPLLSLASRLRGTAVCEDVAGLQRALTAEIKAFQDRLLQWGLPQEQVGVASYAVCSLLDEAALNTPWGARSFWGHQTLLVLFHKESFGGEKFFHFLDRLMRSPARNRELLELLWLCLALGFEGKYRLIPQGGNELERVRTDVFQAIRREPEAEISPRWRGVGGVRNPLVRHVPAWVLGAAAAAVLLLAYLGFALALGARSDAVARDLYAAAREQPTLAARGGGVPFVSVPGAKAERFNRILRTEIQRGQVEVVEDRTLRVRNAFPPGSDRLKPEYAGLFEKIARELAAGGDQVLITGHTDDKPIVSARFPSNFELSAARARNVTELMMSAAKLDGKVRFEGRSDFEPLVPNDSSENRAVNRRVDLLVQ